MSYRVEQRVGYVFVEFNGDITALDLFGVSREIGKFETGGRVPHRLTDLSKARTRDTNLSVIRDVAMRRRGQTFPNAFRSAIYAPNPDSLAMAEKFRTLNTNPQINVRIFATLDEAEEWLRSAEE